MRRLQRIASFCLAAANVVGWPAPELCGTGKTAAAQEPPRVEAFREGFEDPSGLAWRQEETDATVRLLAHDRSKRAAHQGELSERFAFDAGIGSAVYYSFEVPRVPVVNQTKIGLYVRSNRAGMQLFARVVLPADKDPESGKPSFVMVPGTIYDLVDRWQRLDLVDLPLAVERQARILRADTRRTVSIEGAYVERIVVNLYGGVGSTEVFLDEFAIAPVPSEAVAAWTESRRKMREIREKDAHSPPRATDAPAVTLVGNRLKRGGNDWVPTVIRAPGADITQLRSAGFKVYQDDIDADPARFEQAISRGFALMPDISAAGVDHDTGEFDVNHLMQRVLAFPFRAETAFWNVGDDLGRDDNLEARLKRQDQIRATVAALHGSDLNFSKIATGTVADDFAAYSRAPRNIDLIGVHPSPLATMQVPLATFDLFKQRRDLTILGNAGGLFLGWVDATPPRDIIRAVWGDDEIPAWGRPRVQPEQLRIYALAALSAGYRGLGFRADADLTRERERALFIEMAFLNEEIDLFESLIASGEDPITQFKAFYPEPKTMLPPPGTPMPKSRPPEAEPHPGVRVASIRTRDNRGKLLLINDFAKNAQFVPPQMALNDLTITVPAPASATAWEITPGEVRLIGDEDSRRVPGGRRLIIREFAGSTMVLITTDISLVQIAEMRLRPVRPMAVALAIEQAALQLEYVKDINERLELMGYPLIVNKKSPGPKINGSKDLLAKAESSLLDARAARDRQDYPEAWLSARRVSRPLRQLMRLHWEEAFDALREFTLPPDQFQPKPILRRGEKPIDPAKKPKSPPVLVEPVSAPPLACYDTLPQFYLWLEFMKQRGFGPNLVSTGDFEHPAALESAGWLDVSREVDGIESKFDVSESDRAGGKRHLHLSVKEAKDVKLDGLPPAFDFPVAALRSPTIAASTGELFKISVRVLRVVGSVGSGAGVVIRDSFGGETFEYRENSAIPEYSTVVLYRRAPSDEPLTITLGLAGYGDVFFDDLRVERVTESRRAPREIAGRPREAGTATVRGRTPATPSPTLPRPETAGRPAPRPRRVQ